MLTSKRLRFLALPMLLVLAAPVAKCVAQDNAYEPATSVNEQPKPKKPRLTIKPSASLYIPTDDKVKSRFGDSWTMIGFSVDYRDENRSKNRFQFQADSISRKSGADHVRVYPLGIKYTRRLNDSRLVSPYFGGTASLCIADVKSQADNIDTGLKSAGFGASTFVGANVGMNLKLEAAYHMFPDIEGFDFSGLSVGASLQF